MLIPSLLEREKHLYPATADANAVDFVYESCYCKLSSSNIPGPMAAVLPGEVPGVKNAFRIAIDLNRALLIANHKTFVEKVNMSIPPSCPSPIHRFYVDLLKQGAMIAQKNSPDQKRRLILFR